MQSPPRSQGAGDSLALGLLAAALYAAGACRSIYVGDSGELVAAVHVLGIPHPSGYPLYVLLGKLWSLLLPFGSVAFRMSLFSAACAGAAVGVLHALCRRSGLSRVASATAALLLAVSPSFWGEANVQRVYALNALFLALAAAFAFEWHRTRQARPLLAAFFCCGLGATNHTFMGVFAIVLGVFALASEPGLLRRPRTFALSALACAAGLLPYAYLPIRSRMDPPLDWGNPESLDRFLAVVARRDFWDRKWLEAPADLVPIALDYARSLAVELLVAGTLLAVVGAVTGWRHKRPVLLPLLAMAANLAIMAAHGSRSDIFIWHRYYIPSYLMAAILVGIGVDAVLARASGRVRLLPLALPALGLLLHFREFDRSRYRIAEEYSRTLLATLPPGAHLAASDDNILFVLLYLRLVEGARPDLDLIPQGVGEAELPPLRFNPDDDPLFFTHHPNWGAVGLDVVPIGLVFRTARAGHSPPAAAELPEKLPGEDDPGVPQDYLTRNLIGEFHYMKGISAETRDWPFAWREFTRAQAASPENDVLFYNLGLIFRRNGLYEEALAAFRHSAAINPRRIASRDRVVAADKVRELQTELDRARALEGSLQQAGQPGMPDYHVRLAEQLEARGETLLARAHRLRAELAGRAAGALAR